MIRAAPANAAAIGPTLTRMAPSTLSAVGRAVTAAPGRQFLLNTAVQYRAGWHLWPEFEVNSTSFLAGKNAGTSVTSVILPW